jgi:cell division protein ZapA
MQNLIPINIVVGDRTYRIKIESNEEEKVRKMAKKLNEQLATYKSQYAGKDMQDYLAMVLLSIVSEQSNATPSSDSTTSSIDFQSIESILDKALNSK